MSDIDFSFFLEPPELSVAAQLTVEALTPLSMTTAQPGTYYRSQRAPTLSMLYGMLENALGWHFGPDDRRGLLKGLRKQAGKALGRGHELKDTPWITGDEDRESGVGFVSLLQHHLKFATRFEPATTHFDDLWSKHIRGNSTNFPGGSRNNDYRLERVINLERKGDLSFSDRKGYDIRDLEALAGAGIGDKVHVSAIRSRFPQYYVSPIQREYVIPDGPYRYRVEATPRVAEHIEAALHDPAAPLYLGSNDGWVDATWEVLA